MLYEPIKTSSTLSKLGTLQFNFVVHICIFPSRTTPKKSHSTLRAKPALHFEWTKLDLKYQKNGVVWRLCDICSLWSSRVTRKVTFNWTNFKNSNATFLVIFKHCDCKEEANPGEWWPACTWGSNPL